MKVLVTGVSGQLGFDVVRVLNEQNIENLPCSRETFSLTDFEKARSVVTDYKPDAIIHAAAYTAVDKAEEDIENAFDTNYKGTENLAQIARDIDAKFVYISTDYVFPGDGEKFYETDDPKKTLNAYGKSKLLGESAVLNTLEKLFIVRISWVFGKNGNNFVKTMINLEKIAMKLKW